MQLSRKTKNRRADTRLLCVLRQLNNYWQIICTTRYKECFDDYTAVMFGHMITKLVRNKHFVDEHTQKQM